MTTSSVLTEKQMHLVKPDEDLMFERQDFDRAAIRQEFAPVRQLDQGQRFVEQGDAMFIHPDSDMPEGPTGLGESMGSIDLVRVTGEQVEIPRYTHGFTLDIEDTEVDDTFVNDMRQGILEVFDIQADLAFMQGLDREDGTTVIKGVFQWLQDNMPASNIIDASTFDPSAGDLQGVPANIITQEAWREASGEYLGDNASQWDLAFAKPEVWADWNQYGTFDGAVVQSQWDLVDVTDNSDGVGVRRRITIPRSIGLRGPPSTESLTFPIDFPTRVNTGYTSPLDDAKDDALWLVPQHNGDFYELWEQGEPDVRGPLEKEGWKERFEYKWRAGVVYAQTHRTDSSGSPAKDAIKIENVTALFD